jgi:geranylgeranyl diphosphate synthase type II
VTLQGLEASKAEVLRLSKEAVEELKSLPGDTQFLEQLILHLIYRKK